MTPRTAQRRKNPKEEPRGHWQQVTEEEIDARIRFMKAVMRQRK